MWNITDSHSDTRGACPYVCIEAFANDKHLGSSKPAAPRPAPGASATALSVPPPAVDPPAPPAAQETPAAAHSIRLSEPAPGSGGVIPAVDDGTLVVPAAGDSAPPLQDGPAFCAAVPDDDVDWPAFRSSPVWLPNSAVTGDVYGNLPETLNYKSRVVTGWNLLSAASAYAWNCI
ncbi:hypothetical protein CYMTET_6612 [Cymbomonas tetramitiformis]|uniref:Uncharacterized protein n=1 Tax=Cymbomonas tetramitiformis TaxID=36881 RepID=A0AAE0LHQ6_9CHLO|nr:hypothetical protein CYMTET_6612 [Cymbomonas tetramitiformis]